MTEKRCHYCGEVILNDFGCCENCKELLKKKAENLVYVKNNKEFVRHKSNILAILCFIGIFFEFISFGQDLFNVLYPYGLNNNLIVSIKNIFIFIPEWVTIILDKSIFIILLGAIVKFYHPIIKHSHLLFQLVFLELILGVLELISYYQGINISYSLMLFVPLVTIYIMVIMFLIGKMLIKSNNKDLFFKLGIGFIALSITIPLELILVLFFWKIAVIGLLLNLSFMIFTFSQINKLFAK